MSVFKDFVEQVQKDFKKAKKNIVFDAENVKDPIPSGSIVIDKVFGGGLFYRGAMGEIASFESGGKTTLALQSCAEALKKYPNEGIIYFDFEKALDPVYAKSLGVDIEDERVMVFTPDSIEDMMKVLSAGFSKKKGAKLAGKISTIVIDSVAAARPMASIDMEDTSAQKSQHASAWSEITPKLMNLVANYNIAMILINQFRAKPMIDRNSQFSLANTGIGQGYSNMETSLSTTGGNAIRYYLSVRYVTKFVSTLKEQVEDPITGALEEVRVANVFKIMNIKNKINKPYASTKFVIRYGEGTDDFPLIFDALKAVGIIYNKGSFLYYKTSNGEEVKELGRTAFVNTLRENYYEDMKKQFLNLNITDDKVTSSLNDDNEDIPEEEITEDVEL